MSKTQNEIISSVTREYLDTMDQANPPAPVEVEQALIDKTNAEFTIENTGRSNGNKIKLLQVLTHSQIAVVLCRLHGVVAFANESDDASPARNEPQASTRDAPDDKDMLAVYAPDRGIYMTGTAAIRSRARQYNNDLTLSGFREVEAVLRETAARMCQQTGSRWLALVDGDFDFETKEMHPFSPARPFLARNPHRYNPEAENVEIVNPDDTTWDVETWMLELACDTPALAELLWQVLGAAVRPQHRWNKFVGLYDAAGNNGKGTFVELARNLVGRKNNLSASIVELSDPATQAVIPGKSLITSDENDVNAFVKQAGVFKKLVTGDPILANPKYEKPFNYSFKGFQVHCLNEFPKFSDKTDSMWRRCLLIPMMASFKGCERKYIKADYIARPDVLEYVLKRVLEMDFDTLSETEGTAALLDEAKVHNDPARRFWDEFKDVFVWDLLPLAFLYDYFKPWFLEHNPSGRLIGSDAFRESIRAAVNESDDEWNDLGRGEKMKVAGRMVRTEHRVHDYPLDSQWYGTMKTTRVFSNVIFRDTEAKPLMDPRAVAAETADVARDERIRILEGYFRLKQACDDDYARWEKVAATEAGITEPDHMALHVSRLRAGLNCVECGTKRHSEGASVYSKSILGALSAAKSLL